MLSVTGMIRSFKIRRDGIKDFEVTTLIFLDNFLHPKKLEDAS